MADLLESSTFPAGITRIETSEPVIGGESGVANRAPKQLASRTRWLKDQIDALAATLGSLYALRTGDYTTLRARATTKDDVGLGQVANYPPTNDAADGSTTKVATAAAVKAALDSVVVAPTNLGLGGAGNIRSITSSTGANVQLPNASAEGAGLMIAQDKIKLDAIEAGAQANVGTSLGVGGSGDARTITSSTGAAAALPLATTAAAGLMRAADKDKLDNIAPGAQVNVGTDLGLGGAGNGRSITSSTGANVLLPNASAETAGLMIVQDKIKLDGVAAGADVTPAPQNAFVPSTLTFPLRTVLAVTRKKDADRTETLLVRLSTFGRYDHGGSGSLLTGVWRQRGVLSANGIDGYLAERTA